MSKQDFSKPKELNEPNLKSPLFSSDLHSAHVRKHYPSEHPPHADPRDTRLTTEESLQSDFYITISRHLLFCFFPFLFYFTSAVPCTNETGCSECLIVTLWVMALMKHGSVSGFGLHDTTLTWHQLLHSLVAPWGRYRCQGPGGSLSSEDL